MQAIDEPHKLFFGDIGKAQIEGDRLAADYAAQHWGGDGPLTTQIDLSPQSLITAPVIINKRNIVTVQKSCLSKTSLKSINM